VKSRSSNKNRTRPKRILRLPDLDRSKVAVLNTLSSPDSPRSYRFAMDDFTIAVADGNRSVLSQVLSLHRSDQRQSASCVEAFGSPNHLAELAANHVNAPFRF
jgi:hypothetical protein